MYKWLFAFLLLFFFNSLSFADSYQESFQKAMQAYERADYDEAVRLLNKAIELNPDSAQAYNALGLVYRDKGSDLSEISWCFKVASTIDPSMVEPYENLGKLYWQSGELDLAEEYLRKAYDLNPGLPSVQFALGWLYVKGKPQPNDAIYFFTKILERQDIPSAQFGLGLAYAMKKDNAMVLELITKLRSQGYIDYAAQLEDSIRNPYVPQKSSPGPARKPAQPAILVGAKEPKAPTPPPATPTINGSMRVRLKGKLYNTKNSSPNEVRHPGSLGQ